MSAQVYSIPGQTERRSKAFLKWKSIDLSHELFLIWSGNTNYYKSFLQPIPTRENREHPGNFQNGSVSSAFNWVLPFYFQKWNRYFSACKRKFLESSSQFFFKCCINLQCHQIKLLYTFLAQALYTLVKSSLLKCKFWGFSSARVNIRQIPHVNFELTSQFLVKFCIILHCHNTKLPCKF